MLLNKIRETGWKSVKRISDFNHWKLYKFHCCAVFSLGANSFYLKTVNSAIKACSFLMRHGVEPGGYNQVQGLLLRVVLSPQLLDKGTHNIFFHPNIL